MPLARGRGGGARGGRGIGVAEVAEAGSTARLQRRVCCLGDEIVSCDDGGEGGLVTL